MFIGSEKFLNEFSQQWPMITEKSVWVKKFRFLNQEHHVALPVTFTPFASVEPCTARCTFCSETLIYKHSTQLSANLRPGTQYMDQLAQALAYVREVPVGVSLSGLEATSQPEWLLDVLDVLQDNQKQGGIYDEKILYTNGTGLAPDRTDAVRLLQRLRELNWSRLEMSRHSVDQKANDLIMRYRKNVSVQNNSVFEETVRRTQNYIPVKLVCIIQDGGVSDCEEMDAYLSWAHSLGVKEVVFRELSRLQGLYKENITATYVESRRVGIETLLNDVIYNSDFEKEEFVSGYYYWNAQFTWKKHVRVIFETSDYEKMKHLHDTDTIYKFVFHANGNLCADWDPNTKVLYKAERKL